MPALNEADDLDQLLLDLARRWPRAEVVVVDGGSLDATARILGRFPGVRRLCPRVVGARFDVRFGSARGVMRLVAWFMNTRSRLSGIATGDQAMFVRRRVFDATGGFPELPLMEDVEFSRRLKRRGRIACLRLRVTASARKWEREGPIRTILLMWALRLLYFCGASPARLHRWYYGTTGTIPPPEHRL